MFVTLRFAGGFHRVTQGSIRGGLSRMEKATGAGRRTLQSQEDSTSLITSGDSSRPFTTAVQPQKRVERFVLNWGKVTVFLLQAHVRSVQRAAMPAK